MEAKKKYLVCERRSVFALLTLSAGMMGAYTFNLRGGVFCNAQTANVVLMAIAFGSGEWGQGCYYLIPITAYLAGAFLSEILPSPVRRFGFLRWDTYLVAFEFLALFSIGFIPLGWPHQLVQVLVNFIASMQYNTFRQAEGIPMATTFCTNHVRQVGVGLVHALHHPEEPRWRRKVLSHLEMLAVFVAGCAAATALSGVFLGRTIWWTLLPLGIVGGWLLYADLKGERGRLEQVPKGH